MDDDDYFIEVGGPIPRILTARHIGGMFVEVTWDDGRQAEVDLAPAIASHRHFVSLRNDETSFAKLVVSDRGDCLIWPEGQELSAVWIDRLSTHQLGNDEFRDAMEELHLSLDGMASQLGVARRLIADYRKDKPIPKTVALATQYLLDRHRRSVEKMSNAS